MIKNIIKDLTIGKKVSRQQTKESAVFQIVGNENCFMVESDDKRIAYKVKWDGRKGVCSCDDYQKNHKGNGYLCEHITVVKNSQDNATLLKEVKKRSIIAQIANKPFTEDQIKYRGDGMRYVEAALIIKRMNDTFGTENWSGHIIKQHERNRQIVTIFRLTIHIDGRCVSKEQVGECRFQEEGLNYGDGCKASATDALKKCASHFGIGLHLYTSSSEL